jgi:hypothetical protein
LAAQSEAGRDRRIGHGGSGQRSELKLDSQALGFKSNRFSFAYLYCFPQN